MRPPCKLVIALVALLAAIVTLDADASADAYLRVITQQAPVYTGPGTRYRKVYVAARGDVFEVTKRGTKAFWFKIRLEDGTTGWIYGELVFPFEVVEDTDAGIFTRAWRATRSFLFAPSPVPTSDVEISFSAGVLAEEGVFILRPAYLLDPHWAIEGYFGLSPRKQQNLFLYGAGWTFRLWPGSALGPHVYAGVGGAALRKKADAPVGEDEDLFTLNVGGGFELTFKKQITVRLDFRNWTIWDPDKSSNSQEYSGGLAIFF